MPIVAKGGAGGTGEYENGGAGGDAGSAGSNAPETGNAGGAAGTPPGGAGGSGGSAQTFGGGGGGGGANGSLSSAVLTGGRGGDGGAAGTAGVESVGGGGGGGGGAGAELTSSYSGTTTVSLAGGDGGDGASGGGPTGTGDTHVAGGGSGGGGGDGIVMASTALTLLITAGSGVVAGNGGKGGLGSYATASAPDGPGGNGGDGGDGLYAGDSNTITNLGLISGGEGGVGGVGGQGSGLHGATGHYGAGIVGSNLTVVNAGTIAGGHDASGLALGNAITFTAGANTLTLAKNGTAGRINGNISFRGSLDIQSGGTASSLSGGLLVFGAAATAVTIESGVTLADTLSGFVAGDKLDFAGVAFSSALEAVFTASATGGTLRIFNVANPNVVVAQATLVGSYTSGVFGLSSDGNGGTTVGFTATPSLGFAPGDIVTSSIPGSAALAVVDRYNTDYSLYQGDTITKASNGNYTFHFQGGSYFNGKTFQSFDNVTNSSGLLLSQTLYDGTGFAYQQTQFNANGSIYLQDQASKPASGQVLYNYNAGSYFNNQAYSSFTNLATTGGTLLDQILYNKNGSHTFTVPGSNLTLTAQKNDTFNVSGQNDTTRFNATGFGADTFNGYKAGDIFSFSTSIFANYTALSQHLSGTSSAVITDANNDTLTLANVAKSSVTQSMFTFS